MGHLRLGPLPRTRKWRQVVELLEGDAGTPQVAAATLMAAQAGFAQAGHDPGVIHTVWLLTQLPLAARQIDFLGRLRQLGLAVSDQPSVLEVVSAFQTVIDNRVRELRRRSDVNEMAQLAAGESLTKLITPFAGSLFEPGVENVQEAFRRYSTEVHFGELARDFFSGLTTRYLSYFLSKELSNQVGSQGRFVNIDQHTGFNEALALHCRQASLIVQDYASAWFSKANFEGGITSKRAARFVARALKKIEAELARGGHAHVA